MYGYVVLSLPWHRGCLSSLIIKNYITVYHCIMQFQGLIGLAAMAYEPLYHGREKATIELSSGCSCKAQSAMTIHCPVLVSVIYIFCTFSLLFCLTFVVK